MAEYVPKLGEAPSPSDERDAIHIAVVPVTAAHLLQPGQHVGLRDNLLADSSMPSIGVVDPFLAAPVETGQSFWLLLYPGTAIGLRHVYTHPVLDAKVLQEVKVKLLHSDSLQYIENVASDAGLTVKSLMESAENFLEYGDYLSAGSKWEGFHLEDEFWTHYENVTGREVPHHQRHSFFSCSC